MATIPTQNAVPSEAPRDLKFNSGKIDEFVTSLEHEYKDRFGRCHMTIEGMRWIFDQLMERFKVDINQAIIAAGYIPMDSFQLGAEITKRNEILRDETTGEYYRWDGDLPKTVPAGSTPESAGGVGVGAWVGVGDASLRSELSKSSGSSMVGHGDITVGEKLGQIDEFSLNAGFNKIGRFLSINKLREHKPVNIGMIVYVASAYSETDDEHHYGGGYFQSFDNSVSPVEDDGGIVIVPASGNIAWRRINFDVYDACFWGVKPDGNTDNAPSITMAQLYAKNNRVVIIYPQGNIHTSETVPIYSNSGIRGQGKAESTVFYKTTNNKFKLTENGNVVEEVDALCVFVSPRFNLTDSSSDTYSERCVLESCMFRRLGLTKDNVAVTRPYYGLFMGKSGAPLVRRVVFECAFIGIKGHDIYSGTLDSVAASQYAGYGYAGVDISRYVAGVSYMSGTSMDMRLVQVQGYQFGFHISRLQYSTLTNCTAEVLSPLLNESICYAFNFEDPYSITMMNCATEFISGGQVRVVALPNQAFRPSLKITGYLAIDQKAPQAPTPMFSVDGGGEVAMNVVIDASDLTRQPGVNNLLPPSVSGSGTKVIVIGCAGEDWNSHGGGAFNRLA